MYFPEIVFWKNIKTKEDSKFSWMFSVALKIIALSNQGKEIGSHTVITPPLRNFSRPIQSHVGWDGEKSPCLVRSENPSWESFENLIWESTLNRCMILGAIYFASGPSLSNWNLFQSWKSVILQSKGSVTLCHWILRQCHECFLLTHPNPPPLKWLAWPSPPGLTFQKLQNPASLFGFHRENYAQMPLMLFMFLLPFPLTQT